MLNVLAAYGAFLGGTGVVAGALGSHFLRKRLTEDRLKSWQVAVQYQLLHAIAILALGLAKITRPQQRQPLLHRALTLWSVGATLFSGSIYMLCLDRGPRGLMGPATPIGGLVMIAGWGSAFLAAL